jgi:hypothetical protein
MQSLTQRCNNIGDQQTYKGGFTGLFKEKEIINWLQATSVEFDFTSVLAEDTV